MAPNPIMGTALATNKVRSAAVLGRLLALLLMVEECSLVTRHTEGNDDDDDISSAEVVECCFLVPLVLVLRAASRLGLLAPGDDGRRLGAVEVVVVVLLRILRPGKQVGRNGPFVVRTPTTCSRLGPPVVVVFLAVAADLTILLALIMARLDMFNSTTNQYYVETEQCSIVYRCSSGSSGLLL